MTISQTEANALYTERNNNGEGYAPAGETVSEAVEALVAQGGVVVLDPRETDSVKVVAIDGKLVAIGGDGTGGEAWAIKIGQA